MIRVPVKPVKSLICKLGLEQIIHRARNGDPRIIMYHRVLDYPSIEGVSPSIFAEQMEYLARRYRVVSMDQMLDEMRSGDLKPFSVVITFDDGHSDFYHNAWPVLRRLSLPATLFVTTGFVDNKVWLWPDLLRYLIDSSEESSATINGLELYDLSLQNKHWAWSLIADLLLPMKAEDRDRILQEISRDLYVPIPKEPTEDYVSVSWQQLLEMQDEGLDVASHSVTHPILSRESDSDIEYQLIASYQRIQKKLGVTPKGICYPNGMREDIDNRVVSQAKALYEYGVMALNACPSVDQLFELGRIPAAATLSEFKWRVASGSK